MALMALRARLSEAAVVRSSKEQRVVKVPRRGLGIILPWHSVFRTTVAGKVYVDVIYRPADRAPTIVLKGAKNGGKRRVGDLLDPWVVGIGWITRHPESPKGLQGQLPLVG